ncbi:methionine ABC transporter ATP-binding protein [Enterococcus sp. UD-01]|jgi:D-methionine transport system ATP-binding protein|uniref:methionine ABC transporter ATP-binding protein n=1 Tax=Enterococcus sp. UD-01 TaxID=3373911 RepID=UPI003837324E
MITFENVSKTYTSGSDQVAALTEVNLTIAARDIFGIIGESGSGKSTLLRMINTLEQPTQGQVKIDGVDLKQLTKQQQRQKRKEIGMIFQQFNLLYNQTVHENIALPLRLAGNYEAAKVQEVLAFVGLQNKERQYPKQLSGGEKQRVGIARALITQPKILLCDEPTSALDGQNAHDIMKLLRKINQVFGTTMIVVSHELSLIKQLCSKAAVLENGKVLEVFAITNSSQEEQYNSYYERVQENLR